MAADLRVDASNLLGLVLGIWIYGVYTAIFTATLMMMKKRKYTNKIVWGALVSLWVLCTGNAGLSVAQVYEAFITHQSDPGTVIHLKDVTNPIPPARDVFYAFSILISDALLLWRLRMVWPRNIWVFGTALVPVGCSYVCGLISAGYEIALAVTANEKYKSPMEAWAGATFGLVLLGNLVINGLMAGRLWWFHRTMAPAVQQRNDTLYKKIIVVIIESGAIYSAFMIIPVLMYAAGATNTVSIPIYCLPAMVGLVPTLMILRLNWNPIQDSQHTLAATQDTSASVRWAPPTGSMLSNNHAVRSDPRVPHTPAGSFGNVGSRPFISYDNTVIMEQDATSDQKSDIKSDIELEKFPTPDLDHTTKGRSQV